MKKKVAILGHFGGNKDYLDGQTVKTKILLNELHTHTEWNIQTIDTYLKKRNPIGLMAGLLWSLILRKDIIVLLSINGMKLFFPILSFFARHWHVRVFHDVIGGNLDKYVAKYPQFEKYLNTFTMNWVETEILRRGLIENGVSNCEVIPNFKRLHVTEIRNNSGSYIEPYRFCTFSRVMKEKGIEIAIKAVEQINNDAGREVCTLDIYGVIDDSYKEDFEELIAQSTSSIRYSGVVPYSESVETIQKYYALLFPTYWDGEGFPGTIVDAFSAGLPVIASDWNSNKEIIKDGENGILYPGGFAKSLEQAIDYLINHSDQILRIKKQCVIDAQDYQPDQYIKKIIEELERNN